MTDKQLKQTNMSLTVVTAEHYDPLQDTLLKSAQVRMSVDQIRTGLIPELGARDFLVLLVITAHMNAQGKSFPSQKTIAELTGYSRQTVATAVVSLENTYVGDKPVISRTKVPTGDGKTKTVYSFINQVLSEDEVKQEEVSVEDTGKSMTAKDVIVLFSELYEKEFGVAYIANWGRDSMQINNKLIGKFTDEQITQMVTIAVTKYKDNWYKPNYPRTTIGQLTTWLGNEALKVAAEEEKKVAVVEARQEQAEKAESYDSLSMLDDL